MLAYSVLTHEEIVDLLWTAEIRPLLLKRFPNPTEVQITEAHSYAYGGAVIRDLGYYPFGSVEFSNLMHYVRSGDLVRELILQSQDADESAFALGALAHNASDIVGHRRSRLEINRETRPDIACVLSVSLCRSGAEALRCAREIDAPRQRQHAVGK